MSNLMKPIAESLRLTDYVVELVMDDVKNKDARQRARKSEGPSISWIVGHLCHYRYEMMKAVGEPVESPFAQFIERATDGSDYPDLAELRQSWKETSERVQEVADRVTDDQLTAPAAIGPHDERTVLDRMVFFMWHESYHMGQLGTIRAQLGLTPTAELVTRAAQSMP